MKALLIPVDDIPREIEINDYKDIQKAVGGWIESCSWIFDEKPSIYINEEGKLNGSMPNRAIRSTQEGIDWYGNPIHVGDVVDIIFGDFVAIGFDPETGEDRDISDEEIQRVMERFGENTIGDGYIEALKIQAAGRKNRP